MRFCVLVSDVFSWSGILVLCVEDSSSRIMPVSSDPIESWMSRLIRILSLINFMGILSVNLAILNILPLPALDGGRVFFVALEGIVGKKVLPKVENYVHMVGMLLLIALLILITIGDLRKLISAGSLSNFVNSMIK